MVAPENPRIPIYDLPSGSERTDPFCCSFEGCARRAIVAVWTPRDLMECLCELHTEEYRRLAFPAGAPGDEKDQPGTQSPEDAELHDPGARLWIGRGNTPLDAVRGALRNWRADPKGYVADLSLVLRAKLNLGRLSAAPPGKSTFYDETDGFVNQ